MKLSQTALGNKFRVKKIIPFGAIIRPADTAVDITDIPISAARELAREHHLLVFREFNSLTSSEGLVKYAKSWGATLSWPFGEVLELVQHEHPVDHVFDSTGVSLHWDGMFMEKIPEFQIFQCVNALGSKQGGRTIFCDTTRVLSNAAPHTRKLWGGLTLTYQIVKESHYGGAAVSPLIVEHPDRGFPTMRYLEPVPDNVDYINRPKVTFQDVPAEHVADIEQTLRDALYDSRHCYTHSWKKGDLIVADNYTLLHGRESYASGQGRHLRRVHILGNPPLMNPALP